jgi:hypothetical protein
MAQYAPKHHVSAALASLQRGVSFAALLVCFCAVLQMLVFGFLHFTQVRYDKVEHAASVQALSVVGARDAQPAHAATTEPPPPPRILSNWDPALHVVSDMAVTAGVIGTCMLAALTLLGVAVAGGGAVPGVDRVVSSCTWSLALALICIPWRDVLPSLPFPGVFSNYVTMAQLSDAVDSGQSSAGQLLVLYLLFPLAAMGGSLQALGRFRSGVAEGIIVTSVSELDERLEKEIAQIRARGVVASGTPRAVAALNEAIGDKPVEAPDPLPRRAPERPVKQVGGLAGLRARQVESDDDEYKRPI